jgi:hypothetical protein
MKVSLKTKLFSIFIICGFVVLPAAHSQGAVIVYDRVTTVGTPVYLKVLTKGRVFASGGKLVEFYLNDKPFGKNLTGGDGYGYLKYTPEDPGLFPVKASSDGERGAGLVLVMKKSEKAILIEIEGGFKDAFISEIAAGAIRQAVEKMLKKYRIIYLSRYTGIRMSRDWLDEEEFPQAPVLRWQGSKTLSALKEKGIDLHAIIGSAGVIAEAADHIEKRYTFEQTKDGQTVRDWEEIIKSLPESAADVSGKDEKNKSKETKP